MLTFSSALMAQTIHIVNNTPGAAADFTSLQDAINAASTTAVDIIYIQQSPTSYGNITIDRGVTLVGRSHRETNSNYRTTLGNITIAPGASDTTINGLYFDTITGLSGSDTITNFIIKECYFRDYTISSTNLSFNNLIIQGNFIIGPNTKRIGNNVTNAIIKNNVFLHSNTLDFQSAASVIVENNIFRVYTVNNFADVRINNSSGSTLTINDCIFIGTYSGHNLINLDSGSFLINNCLTYNPTNSMSFAGSGSRTINNTIENTNPMFTDDGGLFSTTAEINHATADFSLMPGSPAIGTAIDGGDIGVVYGYDFSMMGQPKNIPYLQIESYSSTVAKGDPLTVTIKGKTN
ncbi:hypothetical protein [Algibacter sp. 2305UL17-15]|uniref:hypothetical protein n=1 Tax=Algibacter sp. 2305UL17-15 TaxID=3231268 RepID=UPI0034574856